MAPDDKVSEINHGDWLIFSFLIVIWPLLVVSGVLLLLFLVLRLCQEMSG